MFERTSSGTPAEAHTAFAALGDNKVTLYRSSGADINQLLFHFGNSTGKECRYEEKAKGTIPFLGGKAFK